MLRVSQCKTSIDYNREQLIKAVCKKLKIENNQIEEIQIVKRSLDARHKPDLYYSMTLDVQVKNENQVYKKVQKDRDVNLVIPKEYEFPYHYSSEKQKDPYLRPIIVGAGPAGLVCAYYLAQNGFRPILLERGKSAVERKKDVDTFWETGKLNPDSNVQFGEGGAGTFSDGKLNTLVKDKDGRCRAVLKLFADMGAPESILYDQKPHVGTDLLIHMVTNLRQEIIRLGGEVRFQTKVVDLKFEEDSMCEIITESGDFIRTKHLVLALGHSARDTFEMLYKNEISMQTKAFAVGFRVQHPQSMIDEGQYGKQSDEILQKLGAASYKLTAQTKSGRGVYSFCMCPGGYVVNASSEEGHLAVNGMSYHKRDSKVANSAIILTVTPEDYDGTDPLAGVRFQRDLEKKAFELGEGAVPVQRYCDFRSNTNSQDERLKEHPNVRIKGAYKGANLNSLFTDEMKQAFVEGMETFDKKITGFANDETILAGIESRTSSPLRIVRDEFGRSNQKGIYPCGEGAGYAGGITSAAMDGIYIAQCVARDILMREAE